MGGLKKRVSYVWKGDRLILKVKKPEDNWTLETIHQVKQGLLKAAVSSHTAANTHSYSRQLTDCSIHCCVYYVKWGYIHYITNQPIDRSIHRCHAGGMRSHQDWWSPGYLLKTETNWFFQVWSNLKNEYINTKHTELGILTSSKRISLFIEVFENAELCWLHFRD